MVTKTLNLSIISFFVSLIAPGLSKETKKMISLGRENGWDFSVIGQAPLPKSPVRTKDWLIVPAEQDTSPLPPRALERIKHIYASGIRPQGFVVVHEAPMLLEPETKGENDQIRWSIISPQQKNLVKVASGVILSGVLGIVLLPVILAAAAVVLGIGAALLIPTMLAAGIVLDPILIAVTQDGYWIEIDRWWNE